MRRVVITGIGIISSIGNNVKEVTQSLKNGTSGIVFAPRICGTWVTQSNPRDATN